MDRGKSPSLDRLQSLSAKPPLQTFTTIQSQSPNPNVPSPVRRKPLPPSATPATPSLPPLSTGGRVVAVGEEDPDDRARSPSLGQSPFRVPWLPTPTQSSSPPFVVRDLDQFPRGHSPHTAKNPFTQASPDRQASQGLGIQNPSPTRPNHHGRLASDTLVHDGPGATRQNSIVGRQVNRTMSLHPSGRPPPLHINDDRRSFADDELNDPATITKTPRSPGPNKLTSFFGWRTSPIAENSPTHSGKSHSPGPSPLLPSPQSPSLLADHKMGAVKSNGHVDSSLFAETGFPLPSGTPAVSSQLAEMEEELREISSELAGSIRRELELEDLVERLQLEAQQGPELGRRTSDYFSDSGTSSVKYPPSDVGGNKADDFVKMKRSSEQDKARYKVDMSQKLQEERARRKALELHVQQLGTQAQHIDQERAAASSAANRVRELENTLEDHRRRLKEEKRGKANFEDLLKALRDEIEQYRNERDNLRDEVIPQLQARVDGLEGDASEHQKLSYENTRMQQELQSLKNENTTLINARKLQLEMQQQSPRFTSIAEEDGPSLPAANAKVGLSRSNSVARSSGVRTGGLSRTGSLSRSDSISKERESRESLADRVRDIEMQRDALHKALKSLLDRQNYQQKEHEKKVRVLESERDRALEAQSPRRLGFEKEVTGLRHEINQLRRRADEALVQKWQCEKGLGGLKMDLDRAEQETSSLRELLHEHDILIPETVGRSSLDGRTVINGDIDTHATSASLEKAYMDLQAVQVVSIDKLQEMLGEIPSEGDDAETSQKMDLLLKTMSEAEAERLNAQRQADIYRAKIESLREAEAFHSDENVGLAEGLKASANRSEALASQVRQQLQSNGNLRERLAEAVGRGEQEQKASAARINIMQSKLKTLEEKLMNAQQHSEEAFAQHEEEVRELRESHNAQLQRLKGGLKTPTFFSPKGSPKSPFFGARSPRLDKTTSGLGKSMNEALRTEFLEKKVAELEGALGDADKEMEEVVSRMNMAQIEVMELQSARDDAMRQTRKLQAAIVAEREKVDSLMK
ncbi:MAG: hypothetical protein LQ342_001760 [Letrouitia transgressa]|nr:MAG: hypothetical protein LQ342_001760 [Letrouitia transgressa]